jgi:hypothetical protein
MKILMKGFVHQVFLQSLTETFSKDSFYLTNRIYHPKYPDNYFPKPSPNVRVIPEIQDLKELDDYDIFIGVFGGRVMEDTKDWKIPTVWRTYVPISQNWQYLRGAPVVYNASISKNVTLGASKMQKVYSSNLDGPYSYDYRDPKVYCSWNGNIEKGMVVGVAAGLGYGRDLCEEIKKTIPIDVIENVPYWYLVEAFKDHRVYLEVNKTSRVISAAFTEAMLTGTPIVSNRVGEFKELIEHGKNGFLNAKSHDPQDMVEYASQLLQDKKLAKKISQEERKRALELFSKKRVKESFESAFKYTKDGKW